MKHAAHADKHPLPKVVQPLPAGPPDRVYCAVADAEARVCITGLVERMNADPVVIEGISRGLRLDGHVGDAVGLIYDLAPWTPDSVETVRRIRAVWSDLSILLYPPLGEGIDDLVSACQTMARVRVRYQPRVPDDLHGLENDVLWVLHSHALHQMTALARGAIGDPPVRIRDFVVRFLEILCSGRRAKVDELAREFRVSPRTLERDFAGARFPTPKETADWLMLLYLAYTSDRFGMRLSRIARPLHVTPNHIYRLKRRLLTDFTWSARTASGDLLAATLVRFARRIQTGRGL